MAQQQLSTNTFTVAKWIVSSDSTQGTNTTIASALTAASSGDTIFIRPGTYTENPTLKAGVNLCALESDSSLNGTGNVTIVGKCTFTGAGSVTIAGIELQTNSDFLLAVTGSAASIVNLNNCYLNCSNNTGISFTSSSGSAQVNVFNCNGNLGTTGIALFSHSSGGNSSFFNTEITNTGASTTANTCSAGICNAQFFNIANPFTLSSTGQATWQYCTVDSSATNTTTITAGGGTTQKFAWCSLRSGSASTVTISGTASVFFCDINSTNTNAITGAGTIKYQGLVFTNTSTTINTTTQTTAGTLFGSTTTAPTAGFLGERITSATTAVSVSSGTPASITNISITPGIWDISIVGVGNSTNTAGNAFKIGISTTNNTFAGNSGDEFVVCNTSSSVWAALNAAVPVFRAVVTTTTTYYIVGQMNFNAGTATIDGRISAVRVA